MQRDASLHINDNSKSWELGSYYGNKSQVYCVGWERTDSSTARKYCQEKNVTFTFTAKNSSEKSTARS